MTIKYLLTTIAALIATCDAFGNTLYVANGLGDRAVHAYDATTRAPIAGFNFVPNPDGAPEVLTMTLSGNTLYVAADRNNGIGRYNATTGAPVSGWTSPTGLDYPYGLAVSGNLLYAANYGSGKVGVYNATTGAVINANLTGAVPGAIGVAILGNNLYVTSGGDTGSNQVGVYNATTGATINANFISGLNYPIGLAIWGNSLYVANSGNLYASNGTVGKYDVTTGDPSAGWAPPSGLNLSQAVAVADNRLYVANWLGQTVDAFDATTGAAIPGWTSPSGLGNPAGVAVTPEPASAALLGLGTLLLAARRRRST